MKNSLMLQIAIFFAVLFIFCMGSKMQKPVPTWIEILMWVLAVVFGLLARREVKTK